MKGLSEQDFYATLKDYFSLHASQRIQMLNFYIVLETFLMTAWLTLFQVIDGLNIVRIVLGVSAVFISVVFYILDARTKSMIKLSEQLIEKVEQKYSEQIGEEYMIFSAERKHSTRDRTSHIFKRLFFSYSKLLRLIYLFFVSLGIFSIIVEFVFKC